MYTIFDYLHYYRDIPLKDVHWNTADTLLCSIINYLPAETYYDAKSIGEFHEYVLQFAEGKKENPLVTLVYELMELIDGSERYKNLMICNFQNIRNNDTQFGAATFHAEGNTVISFKGTDYSLIGWFENFRLAYEYPTSTHRLAIGYLKENANAFRSKNLYVCGHSKGGNLALVAAMEAPEEIFRSIKRIYNFDGPGLRKDEFTGEKFRKIIPKLTNIVPTGSVVGVLLNNTDYQVIKSSKIAVSEHYPTSWNLFGECFIEGKLSAVSRRLHETTTKGIENLDYTKTEEAFEYLFRSFGKEYASGFSLTLEDIRVFYENIKNIDPEVKESLDTILTGMLSAGFRIPVKRKNDTPFLED